MTLDEINISDLSEDELIDLTLDSIDTVCDVLESKGIPSDLIESALFAIFSQKLEDSGDRDYFEEVLTAALEEEWDSTPGPKLVH